MVWVRNVFLNYEDEGETSFLFMGRGRNVFPKYELRAKHLTKKWCELTIGRKVCVPLKLWVSVPRHNFKWLKFKSFNLAVSVMLVQCVLRQ